MRRCRRGLADLLSDACAHWFRTQFPFPQQSRWPPLFVPLLNDPIVVAHRDRFVHSTRENALFSSSLSRRLDFVVIGFVSKSLSRHWLPWRLLFLVSVHTCCCCCTNNPITVVTSLLAQNFQLTIINFRALDLDLPFVSSRLLLVLSQRKIPIDNCVVALLLVSIYDMTWPKGIP